MAWFRRFTNVFRAGRVDAEVGEELRFHLEARQRENQGAGMFPAEAHRDAPRRFGGMLRARERSRDADLILWLDTGLQDLRYSLRALRRNPAFTLIAVVTLALATGAVSTVFSLANAFFFRHFQSSGRRNSCAFRLRAAKAASRRPSPGPTTCSCATGRKR